MAKDKKSSKVASAAPGVTAPSKPLESVKNGRVTKPVESAKNAAKDVAKKVKKTAKKVKEPTPEPESESESESEVATSDSSASSDEESDEEMKEDKKPKANGAVKAAAKKDDTSDDSSSASDSDDEAPKVATNGAATTSAAMKDDDDSDSDSDSSDSEEEAVPKINGNASKAAAKDDSDSDSDSESESDEEVDAKAGAGAKVDADSSDDSSSEDEEEEEEEEEVKIDTKPNNKRKASEATEQTPKKIKVNGEEKEATANLFVGNISFNVDEEWLTREFEEFGQLKGVRIITDRESGRPKGYGYVEFEDVSHAVAALEARNEYELDGRNLRVDFSNPRPERGEGQTPQQRSSARAEKYGDKPRAEPSSTLFCGNLSFDADEDTVRDAFAEYGTVSGVRLITDKETGNFKGFGYVEMGSKDEASAALEALNGADIAGRAVRLDFSTPRPTNDGGRGGFGGRGGGRGGFGDRGGRGGRGRGGFGDRGRGRGRGDSRGGRGGSFNRGGFGDFSGRKTTF